MSDTTTAREIAEAESVSKSAIEKRARRESWPFEEVAIRGGRQRHYAIEALPADVAKAVRDRRFIAEQNARAAAINAQRQAAELERIANDAQAWAKAQRDAEMAAHRERQRRKEDGRALFNALSDGDKKQRAYARQYLVELCWEQIRTKRVTAEAARTYIAERVNTGEIALPADIAAYIPKYSGTRILSADTLHAWDLAYRKDGIWGLVDQHGHRKNQGVIDTTPALRKVVLGCMASTPHITAKKIKQYIEAGHKELTAPSAKTIQRFMDRWIDENHSTWLALTNPDKWKNTYQVAIGSHHDGIARLNQLWEMDSTPADWMLIDGRHSVVGVIDLYSRRLKYHVSKTSSAYAVCQTLRAAMIDWGIPECIRTDNGKDYVSQHFTGVLRDLEIEQDLCDPFASEQKGTIERSMRTMSHGILDLLPGFIGHNVAERKVIEARKSFADRIMKSGDVVEVAMTAAHLQKALDQWTEYLYGRDPHSGLNGKSPWEVANAWSQPIRLIENQRALDALLEPVAGVRTVTAEGIRIDSDLYWHIALVNQDLIGKKVTLKRVDHDLGRVHVYHDGDYVCEAECPELLGISRREYAVAATHVQKKKKSEHVREIKELAKDVARNKAEVVIQHRIEQSANVTEFPKRSEEYSTPALDQAARSIPPRNLPLYDYADEPEVPATNNVVAMPAPVSRLQQVLDRDDIREMYQHWLDVNARFEAGEKLSEEEARWHASFPKCAEYRTGKIMAGEGQLTSA